MRNFSLLIVRSTNLALNYFPLTAKFLSVYTVKKKTNLALNYFSLTAKFLSVYSEKDKYCSKPFLVNCEILSV